MNRNPQVHAATEIVLREALQDRREPVELGSPEFWFRIILRAERMRSSRYGLGLASVWSHINKGDASAALTEMDRVERSWTL